MSLMRKRMIMLSIMIGGVIFAGILIFLGGRTESTVVLFAAMGGAISIGGLIWGIWSIRCPHCGGFLPLRDWFIEYCPRCGEKLE